MATDKRQEMEKVYMQFQMLNEQMKETKTQMDTIQSKIVELRALKENLDRLKTTNKQAETWSFLGMSTFVQSRLADTSEVLVNVGAGVFIKKDIASAHKTIDAQIGISEKYMEQMNEGMQAMIAHAEMLQTRAAELSKNE